jgi:hypothetical protein
MMAKPITTDDLEKLRRDLLEDLGKMLTVGQPAIPSGWMKSRDVRRMLNLSPGKLLQLRASGLLPYTKVGRIVYYEVSDIEKLMKAGKKSDSQTPPIGSHT